MLRPSGRVTLGTAEAATGAALPGHRPSDSQIKPPLRTRPLAFFTVPSHSAAVGPNASLPVAEVQIKPRGPHRKGAHAWSGQQDNQRQMLSPS